MDGSDSMQPISPPQSPIPEKKSVVCQINVWLNLLRSICGRNVIVNKESLLHILLSIKNELQKRMELTIPLCAFCRNNKESFEMYTSHKLKDNRGRTTCPILRRYVCPLCGLSGDFAHTIKYCSKFR